jgi:hypothetical protein
MSQPDSCCCLGRAGAAAAFALQQQGRGTSAVEPSDLSEPSGLAPSVSIKQTTAPATASPLPLSM